MLSPHPPTLALALTHAALTRRPLQDSKFAFDFCYDPDSLQDTVFTDIAVPLLDKAFAGYNGTIFAYGQTGQLACVAGTRTCTRCQHR
jgi:hypothetical protein